VLVGVRSDRADGRESRVVSCRDRARRSGTHPGMRSTPPAACAGGAITRRCVSSPWWLEPGLRLAARDRRPRVHPAQRRGVARGGHRALMRGVTVTDACESQGGHARDARPRGGQPGEVTVGRGRHGRAAGPRPYAPERRTRCRASVGRLLEHVASSRGHGSVSEGSVSEKSRRRRCAECITLAVPVEPRITRSTPAASGRDSLHER